MSACALKHHGGNGNLMLSEENEKSVGGPVVRNSALNAAAGMTMLITGFISSIIVARLLGPEANGVIAFCVWLATTGGLVAELGTGVSLLRLLPQLRMNGHDTAKRLQFASWLARPVAFVTLAMVLAYGLIFFFFKDVHWFDDAPEVTSIVAALFIVQSVGSFSKNFLVGEQRLGALFKISGASAVLQLTVITLGALFYGVTGALLGYLAGQTILFAHTLKILMNRPDGCGIDLRGLINSSSFVIVEYIITAIFLTRPEILFLQQLSDVETVGFYAVAISLANMALQLPIQLSGSLVPYFSSQLSANDGKLPDAAFETVIRSFAFLAMPMSFGLAAIAPPLVTAVYGDAFVTSGVIVSILALGAPANVLLQLCTTYVFTIDRPAIRLKVVIAGAILISGGCLLVIPYYGGEGAAIVRNVAYTLMCVYMIVSMQLSHMARKLLMPILRITVAALVMGAAVYALTQVLPGLLGVLAAIVAGVLIYVPALRLAGATTPEDGKMLEPLTQRAPARLRPLIASVSRIAIPTNTTATEGV